MLLPLAGRANGCMTRHKRAGGYPEYENIKAMKILLFGGTFDPIHLAHIQLAEAARQQMRADAVWFLVSPQNPWKVNNTLSDDNARLEMVRIATEGHDALIACDYEFHLEKPSYTYQTLRHLRSDFPAHEFVLLVGGDNWMAFDHWAEYEEIISHHPIAVYPRPGCPVTTPLSIAALPHSMTIIDAPQMDISSTDIRKCIREAKDASGMIDCKVARYITEHNLYG